eukprot:TRINITY_DN29572_c0_g1_i1.p1 TRINITY_DN29572_c0_g1~~TRINITY_DN29572_c0_g1_i1.p1  ORF type:complete len:439 (+),score=51.73 TRINITY_DN29572_c0_g1_i1:218-1534(+)
MSNKLLPLATLVLGLTMGFFLARQFSGACLGTTSQILQAVVSAGKASPGVPTAAQVQQVPVSATRDVAALVLPIHEQTPDAPAALQTSPKISATVPTLANSPVLVTAAGLEQSENKPTVAATRDQVVVQNRCLNERCSKVRPRCRKHHKVSTVCPRDDWVAEMVKRDYKPGKVIVNIGCNKGGDAVAWLQRFDTQNFWSVPKWEKMTGTGFCYTQKEFWTPPRSDTGEYPQAVCVEAVPKTIKHLRFAAHELGYDANSTPGKLHIVHAAATPEPAQPGQTVAFPDADRGFETAGLETFGDGNFKWKQVQVRAVSVDQLVQEYGFPQVDALIIDTEGSDPAILRGSQQALEITRYVQFEVHRDIKGSTWANTTLLSVVQFMSDKKFDCYWAGVDGKLASLTYCWEERNEGKGMQNVACVKRGDIWWEACEKFCPGSELR